MRLVPIDFDRDDIGAILAKHGYPLDSRTFFVCEAVTQYLTGQGVSALFEFLGKAARGSRIAFTYVRKDFLAGTNLYGWKSGYQRFVASGIWISAMEPSDMSGFLVRNGWSLTEDVGYDELADRYIKPAGRNLSSTQVERVVYAEKT
jgi:methyltransferase (TIGR00027 family)